MSQENVDVVRQSYGLIAGQELVGWLENQEPEDLRRLFEAIYTPDIEITWLEANPDQRPYRGHAETVAALADWLDAWERFTFEPTEWIDAGDHVLVRNVQRGIGKGSRVEIAMETTILITVREGRIARVREFADHEEALEAAGLSE
jgi:ketosteroid isomerase-like protein